MRVRNGCATVWFDLTGHSRTVKTGFTEIAVQSKSEKVMFSLRDDFFVPTQSTTKIVFTHKQIILMFVFLRFIFS